MSDPRPLEDKFWNNRTEIIDILRDCGLDDGKINKALRGILPIIDKAVVEARVKAIESYKKINDKLEREIRIDELENLFVDFDDRKLRHLDGTKMVKIDDRIKELKDKS